MICGWLAADPAADPERVIRRMAAALRVHPAQRVSTASLSGLGIGMVGGGRAEPTISADGRYVLWMAGEAYDGGRLCAVPSVAHSRTGRFRRDLLAALLDAGFDALGSLDGRYLIVLFDTLARSVTLANDRFAGEPLFWGRSSAGFAFAGGVRGVLMAPGIDATPDVEAIEEAVTFGGFRLGARTNVRGVRRLTPATVLQAGREPETRRYWRWPPAVAADEGRSAGDLIEQAHALWRQAIGRRLADAARPGQTLSGGLDSRAILAEAASRAPRWTAVTYGIDGCDDIRYAGRAAAVAGAAWIRHALYRGDWVETRAGYIQQTDGLVQLADLAHYEALPVQAAHVDVLLSGYIGDAVCGTSYDTVADAPSLVAKLPFSGVPIAWPYERALAWGEAALAAIAPSAPRFAVDEHKFLQSIHPIFQGCMPHMRLRTPFVDYALFDFFSARPAGTRRWLYHAWLRRRYPAFFRDIPDQRTGVPVGASAAARRVSRAGRLVARLARRGLLRAGLPSPPPRIRAFHDEERFCRPAAVRRALESVILRAGSLSAGVFGRDALGRTLNAWFDEGRGPAQVVGALYVFERYHRDLAATLRSAADAAATIDTDRKVAVR